MENIDADMFASLISGLSDEYSVPKDESIIDKNVLRGNDPILGKNKIKPRLTSGEKTRYMEIFTLFSKVFFYNKRKEEDGGQGTLIKDMTKKVNPPAPQEKESCGSWMKTLGMLAGGALLVAGAIPLLVGAMFEKLGPVADTLKALGKMGLNTGLEMMKAALGRVFKGGMNFFKKLPIVGAIVNFYLAYEHFKNNEMVEGIWELVSGLLNFIPGGQWLSTGMDILKAYLDYKGVFDEGGALSDENAIGTIKEWGSKIGTWIWDNALWLPVIGGIKRFGMAKDAFSGGDYGEGIKQILLGILSLGGGAPLIRGYEVLAGFLSGKLSQQPTEITEDSSWSDRMVEWIREKLKVLPWWIKKPLAWFGIIPDEMVGEGSFNIKESLQSAGHSISEFANMVWDGIWNFGVSIVDKVNEYLPSIVEFVSGIWDSIWNFGVSVSDHISNFISETVPTIIDTIKESFDVVKNGIKSLISTIGSWITKTISSFGGDDGMSEADKKAKAKEAGHQSWAEYEKSGWQYKSRMVEVSSGGPSYKEAVSNLEKIATQQLDQLRMLVNIGQYSLKELQRMSGNKSKGGGVTINASSPDSPTDTPLVPVGDNRMGFANSAYAL